MPGWRCGMPKAPCSRSSISTSVWSGPARPHGTRAFDPAGTKTVHSHSDKSCQIVRKANPSASFNHRLAARDGWPAIWRLLRLIAVVVVPIMMAVEIVHPGWAQLPPANPLVVPQPPPSPPAQLPAPITTAVAPPVAAIPSLPAAYSTPGPRVFNCSCFGPGVGTRWMGQVTASSYFSARQSAGGACLAYNLGKLPSTGVAGGVGAANAYESLPGANQNAGAANRYAPLPGALENAGAANYYAPPPSSITFSSEQCSECTCD